MNVMHARSSKEFGNDGVNLLAHVGEERFRAAHTDESSFLVLGVHGRE